MSDRTPHLNRLLIFIIIILCLICGLLFTQSSAGPFGNSHTSVIAENTGDIAVLSSDKDQNIKLNISGTDISVSPSATPSPTPVKEQDAENVSPEAESGTWTADGTNWKFMATDIISTKKGSCRPAGLRQAKSAIIWTKTESCRPAPLR